MAGKSSEIRTSGKAVRLGRWAGRLMRAYCATLRLEVDDRGGVTRAGAIPGRVIFCLWHDSIFVMPAAWEQTGGETRQVVVLTSASHDGAMLAEAVGCFGLGAVRGSTSRRAVGALVALRKALKEGVDVCITPDGPRGPGRKLQAGLVKLAETSGAVVIPIHVRYSRPWRLKTWDRFQIPRPFSTVHVIFDAALAVPPNLSDSDFEVWRTRIEEKMLRTDSETFSDDPG